MIDTKIIYTREYDNVPVEGVLVDRFTHTNQGYRTTKDIALIFYEDYVSRSTGNYFEDHDGDLVPDTILVTRPLFRYVEVNNDRLEIYEGEKSKYEASSKYELMRKYVSDFIKEYYFEDFIYNFVNYN